MVVRKKGSTAKRRGAKRPSRATKRSATTLAPVAAPPLVGTTEPVSAPSLGEPLPELRAPAVTPAVEATVATKPKPRWRRFFKTRRVISVLVILLLVLAILLYAKLHAMITQDLVITLTPTTRAVTLVNGETVPVSFNLRTNNYLFCEASCDATTTDLSTSRVVAEQRGLLLRNSNASVEFSVTAPARGEGQLLYSLVVSCANLERASCRRGGEPHTATALVTIDYTLTPVEAAARQKAFVDVPYYLSLVKQLDEDVLRLEHAVRELRGVRRVSLDGLENLSGIVAARDEHLVKAVQLNSLWVSESYASIGEVPSTAVVATVNEATAVLERISAYVAAQHALVDSLGRSLRRMDSLERARKVFSAHDDPLANRPAALFSALERLSFRTSEEPSRDVFTRRTAAFEIENETTRLLETATALLRSDTVAAESLAIAERARVASVESVNTTNASTSSSSTASASATTSSAASPSASPAASSASFSLSASLSLFNDACESLRVAVDALPENVTPLHSSSALLERCAAVFSNASLLDPGALEALEGLSFILIDVSAFNATSIVEASLPLPRPACCALGECNACDGSGRLPVLFLHGHSMNERNAPEYSTGAFNAVKQRLEAEGLYVDAGLLTPYDAHSELPRGVWGRSPSPVAVTGTYYYDTYLQGSSYILSLEKSESIDTYAIRVKDLVQTLKERTGSDQVLLVTHSMGGLVARRYAQLFGSGSVAALVMIAPPSNGVDSNVALLCPFFGADKECGEMTAGSPYLAKLNDPGKRPDVPMFLIIGEGCEMGDASGDGVVTVTSAELPGVPATYVSGSCVGSETFHTSMLDPERYPDVYDQLKVLLEKAD